MTLNSRGDPRIAGCPAHKAGGGRPSAGPRLPDRATTAAEHRQSALVAIARGVAFGRVETFNLFAEDGDGWDRQNDRGGYRHRVIAIGERLGASLLGGSLYELAPGESTWPYHYELGCEEWLVVVSGRPTLRTPEGERELAPGDVAVFPEGPNGAHKVSNASDAPARVLILSSKAPLAVVHYPDSKKLGIWSRDEGYQRILPVEPTLDYWEGES